MKHVYGIVPSRRLGRSLGVSTIPFKTCNYSCVYCQLGRTTNMTNIRQTFYPPEEIIDEFRAFVVKEGITDFDVVTIVGEGEPLLYKPLDTIIDSLKSISKKQVVLITNGSLLYDENVRNEIKNIDILMPTLDAWDNDSFKKINRPYGKLLFDEVYNGLLKFRKEFSGQIWLEVMLVKGLNDSKEALEQLKEKISEVKPERVYLNIPVRPPAEPWVKKPDDKTIKLAREILNATSIEKYSTGNFVTSKKLDDLSAVLNVIKRHPMRKEDIRELLKSRGKSEHEYNKFMSFLEILNFVEKCNYRGTTFYRFKKS